MIEKNVSKFEILPHTADAKFVAYGSDMSKAFASAAYAMFEILLKGESIKPVTEVKFSKKGDTKESLLYDFLDELLFLLDTENLVMSKIKQVIFNEVDGTYSVECVALFDNAKNYDIGGNIKAVTYSEIYIKDDKDKVELQVVVDI